HPHPLPPACSRRPSGGAPGGAGRLRRRTRRRSRPAVVRRGSAPPPGRAPLRSPAPRPRRVGFAPGAADRARATRRHVVVPGRARRARRGTRLGPGPARALPIDSPDASITARWHAIYAANRSIIGPDPDVIVPG